jgi:hypothetical protein
MLYGPCYSLNLPDQYSGIRRRINIKRFIFIPSYIVFIWLLRVFCVLLNFICNKDVVNNL